MRIDRLHIQNFRKFADLTLDLHPQFTLLIGGNGAGKTSILEALAICISLLNRGQIKDIERKDVRLLLIKSADRIQFKEQYPVNIKAYGQLGRRGGLEWGQTYKGMAAWIFGSDVQEITNQLRSDNLSETPFTWPIIAYYGVTRAALLSNNQNTLSNPLSLARRDDAYIYWFNERINYDELRRWFLREMAAAGVNGGRKRPGFEVVRRAVEKCVPGATELWFDVDRDDLVCSIEGQAQPLSNLSDGQRMLLARVADIAIKAVTANTHLLPTDQLGPEDEPTPRVLQETPGVVLIDELDVHLHPSWQRRVVADLKRTFPSIQFVCTSHSPQIIGELSREEIRVLQPEGVVIPAVALGADSNWILDHVMEGAASENLTTRQLKDAAEDALAEGDLSQARIKLSELRRIVDGDTGDIVRLESSLFALEALAHEGEVA